MGGAVDSLLSLCVGEKRKLVVVYRSVVWTAAECSADAVYL